MKFVGDLQLPLFTNDAHDVYLLTNPVALNIVDPTSSNTGRCSFIVAPFACKMGEFSLDVMRIRKAHANELNIILWEYLMTGFHWLYSPLCLSGQRCN